MLSDPQLADIQAIMEERGILHLSDYVRQVITQDIRKWRAEHYAQYSTVLQSKGSEFESWLKWKQANASQPVSPSPSLPETG
ncbi:MAG: hypothetical protein LBK99_01925 [Opitutaceae bacterium]|nr:hypothetical protein [Opitutaceae bacterium]